MTRIALLRALAEVLTPAGELIIETYGSRLSGDSPAVEVHQAGEVYQRDDFVYWGFPAEGLRRLARIAGLTDVEVMAAPDIDGHPRLLAILRSGESRVHSSPTRRADQARPFLHGSRPPPPSLAEKVGQGHPSQEQQA